MHSTNETNLNRRALLGATAALALIAGFRPVAARALTTTDAASLVAKVTTELLAIVNTGQSEAQTLPRFEAMFDRYADVPLIARSILGAPWRTASDAQRNGFVAAFRGYLARKYGKQFREYKGASVEIGTASDQGRKGVLVKSTVKVPGKAPFLVEWQVTDAGGSTRLFNLIIEGVSMLSTERAEVAAILEAQRGSVDKLIADLGRRG